MAKRKIVWSHLARIRLLEILEYFAVRNGNKIYSGEKLYRIFKKELKLLLNHPDLGIKTDIASVRGLIVGDYILYYEETTDAIIVHTIWDSRQDPDKLKMK
ncbi:MAG: type II toxin-antitoxin system RelE/ParE family toxin [Cyclobacteriaceae bacterium]|nr:type II toxin-antitoxin system RelE/ParE family toxin [Cyclobacteriaceae bacterium]